MEFKAGDLIIEEGDPFNGLSIIIDGETSIQKKNNMTGKTIELKIRGEGESLGEMALIDSKVRSVTVRAKSDVKIAIINLEYLASVFEEDPRIRADVAINITKILSKRLVKQLSMLQAKPDNKTIPLG
ncbi:MAG: cyclic nucleotide-binding domain-containing protein [Candidatus Marinimicrobia bacterium]|nr:cyclic nucleotide-binding domain-containing protein [Candidatus Neomarinimicrobiota bacterium]